MDANKQSDIDNFRESCLQLYPIDIGIESWNP